MASKRGGGTARTLALISKASKKHVKQREDPDNPMHCTTSVSTVCIIEPDRKRNTLFRPVEGLGQRDNIRRRDLRQGMECNWPPRLRLHHCMTVGNSGTEGLRRSTVHTGEGDRSGLSRLFILKRRVQ
ncbi:hypothetical protein H112_07516 [Trichophyton rubrum D6]|uniref:Uncharacterized protein n=1 Tax=Trichophyton rubrum CBS 288.86 TaxID=1215330 RepID=A0A022VS43_TRIRU|nr:hypothetical protein H103_07529 [Trichophyton rubrum CBS 288.86]EZF91508.1 hypothetical protein H113_07582 [Trichophyton rubrum MR1459]EZG12993.1 hypothetical protein H107_07693 [Trichophyton rubrum CBS 202.88]KDB29975.1 hypothetical protein H112_07516 [Trichophyton rubrum D6]KMQ48181.1 hypothetical protein HL42_1116 [Trichophyton rubrum]